MPLEDLSGVLRTEARNIEHLPGRSSSDLWLGTHPLLEGSCILLPASSSRIRGWQLDHSKAIHQSPDPIPCKSHVQFLASAHHGAWLTLSCPLFNPLICLLLAFWISNLFMTMTYCLPYWSCPRRNKSYAPMKEKVWARGRR